MIITPAVYREIREADRLSLVSFSMPSGFLKAKLTPLERKLAKEIIDRKKLGRGEA